LPHQRWRHPSPPACTKTPIMHYDHASLPLNLHMPCPAPAPSSPPHHYMSLHFQCKTSTPHDISQSCPTPCGPQVSPQAPVPQPATGTQARAPGPTYCVVYKS
ncbi:hypothetical protein C0993_010461, partial [Termitomyces sp. T159_Od127]